MINLYDGFNYNLKVNEYRNNNLHDDNDYIEYVVNKRPK